MGPRPVQIFFARVEDPCYVSPMPSPLRQQLAALVETVVVKIGTRALTTPSGELDGEQINSIARQLAAIADGGRRVVLVSSGAVGAGIGRLGLKSRPTDLAQLQAAAAIGQSRLMEAYNRALEPLGRCAAQVLLTGDDFNDRGRYLNIRNTLFALFDYGAIPIINENDTVRVEELARRVGDNDRLAALVTNLIRAQLLVLLSDVEGVYDGPPRDPNSKVIPLVERIDCGTLGLVQGSANDGQLALSVGGMASKIEAARLATTAGENVVIANGRRPDVLIELLAGEEHGTLFLAEGTSLASRKRWIGLTAHPKGRLILDPGACTALETKGRSLLAVGVVGVEGEFESGDLVALIDGAGREIARGLSNYDTAELRKIAGQGSERFAELLGRCTYKEVVHRNNLTLVRRAT